MFTVILLISVPSVIARDRDLSTRVEPLLLKSLYEMMHENLKIPDVRTETGSWNGVRLVCLNDRYPVFSFTFTQKDELRFEYSWKKIELKKAVRTIKSGEGVLTGEKVHTINEILRSEDFRELPTATLPVMVGHPYFYIMESVNDGNYQVKYRDAPDSMWEKRKLGRFNQLVRAIVISTGVDGGEFGLPSDSDQKPEDKR